MLAPRSVLLLMFCAAPLATCATAAVSTQSPREPDAIGLEYVRTHAEDLGLTAADVADIVVVSRAASASGASHIYVRQRHRGIDVWGAEMTITIARDGRVVSHAGEFVRLPAGAAPTSPALTALAAARAAAGHLKLEFTEPLRVLRPARGAAQETLLSDGGIAANPIPAKLVFHTAGDAIRLAWLVEIEQRDAQHWWVALIDAATGALLEKHDRVTADAVQGS